MIASMNAATTARPSLATRRGGASASLRAGGLSREFAGISARPSIRARVARGALACRASANDSLTLHMGETTISFPLPHTEASVIDGAILGVMETFKQKEKEGQRKRLDIMEYNFKGGVGGAEPPVSMEVVCNPNAFENAFQAKVLVSVKSEQINFTSECLLSALKADVDVFVDAAAATGQFN